MVFVLAMYNDLLQQLGLSDKEAAVYEALTTLGTATAADLLTEVSLKRPTVYHAAGSLVEKGLAEETWVKGKKAFRLTHPRSLEKLLAQQKQALAQKTQALEGAIPSLVSSYNLAVHKPNVQFFEGEEGAARFMEDSLSAKTEILQYHDPAAVKEYIQDINARYVKKRIARDVAKRMIIPKKKSSLTQFAEGSAAYKKISHVRSIPVGRFAPAVLAIYDNKVAYLTMKPESMIGVILEDEDIAEMHRQLFEYTWTTAAKLKAGS